MSKEKRLVRTDYDPEFREQAANLVLVEKMSVSSAAKDLGIPANTLHAWVHKFSQGIWSLSNQAAKSISMVQSNTESSSKAKLPSSSQKQHDRMNDLEAKNRDLEIKLRRMTMERDVLKKAMAYCLEVPK